MVVIFGGRISLDESLYYDPLQHLFLDPVQKTIGIDQVGYYFMKNPTEIHIKVENRVEIDEIFAEVICENGKFPLRSLCSGKIKQTNAYAFHFKDYDTYQKGYILEFESFENLAPGMMTGDQVQDYADSILKCVLLDRYTFKFLIVGDKGAGKSTFRKMFTTKTFDPNYQSTPAIDMDAISLNLNIKHQGKPSEIEVSLNFWDVGGSCGEIEREMYYRESDAVIFVYDIEHPPEFSCECSCFSKVLEILGSRIPSILIANKMDLSPQIDTTIAQQFANEQNILFAKCSAKDLESVNSAIMRLLKRVLEKYGIEIL